MGAHPGVEKESRLTTSLSLSLPPRVSEVDNKINSVGNKKVSPRDADKQEESL